MEETIVLEGPASTVVIGLKSHRWMCRKVSLEVDGLTLKNEKVILQKWLHFGDFSYRWWLCKVRMLGMVFRTLKFVLEFGEFLAELGSIRESPGWRWGGAWCPWWSPQWTWNGTEKWAILLFKLRTQSQFGTRWYEILCFFSRKQYETVTCHPHWWNLKMNPWVTVLPRWNPNGGDLMRESPQKIPETFRL